MKNILRIGFLCVLLVESTRAGSTNDQALPLSSDASANTRYGLFNWLDHRSFYEEGNFPEPFLLDDSGLEKNEARLDWLHSRAGNSHSDAGRVEVEKGFGLLTLELEIPYQRTVSDGQKTQGFENINLGARHPFYQFVSRNGFFDTTFGAAVEVGIPVNSAVSKNAELVPKIFNDTKIGDHLTVQSVLGHSTLFGGGADGGLQTFEYGFAFGCTLQHSELPLPGTLQVIPMFEIKGDTGLNNGQSGQTTLLGNAAVRINLKPIAGIQPRLGLGYVFPMNNNARNDLHWGIFTSLVFEY